MRKSPDYKQRVGNGGEDKVVLAELGCPSLSCLSLHMTPAYVIRLSAFRYLADLGLKWMVQTRTARKFNIDSHYVNSIALYLRLWAKLLDDAGFEVRLFSSDDKAKLAVGAPGEHQSAVQRRQGRVIGHERESVVSLDHDFSCLNLTPSVALVFEPGMVPQDEGEGVDWTAPGSLYRGRAYVTVKDSITQPSNPWRHMAELKAILELRGDLAVIEVRSTQ